MSLLTISRYFPFSWSCPCHSSSLKPPISRTMLSPGPSSSRRGGGWIKPHVKAAVFGSALLEPQLHPIGEECPLPLSLDSCSFLLSTTLLLLPLLQDSLRTGERSGKEPGHFFHSPSLRSFLFCSLSQIERVSLGSLSSPQCSRPGCGLRRVQAGTYWGI